MRLSSVCLLLAVLPVRALAQDTAPPPAISVSGDVTLASDYRFRGVSRSGRDPAPQFTLRADTLSGFYLGAFASRVDRRATDGARAEIDLSGGWTRSYGSWRPDVGLKGYVFPGGAGRDFFELYGALNRDIGPATVTAGFNYSPAAGNLRRDSSYVWGRLSSGIPGTPLSFSARVGRENGALARAKIDWRIGLGLALKKWSFALDYVDTNRPGSAAKAGAVGTISYNF